MTDLLFDVFRPNAMTGGSVLLLVLASFATSAISAAFGLGGGVAMLLALLLVMPPATALPVHGIIQAGSNAGRAWMMRGFILRSLVLWFVPGALLGILLASQIVTQLNQQTLQWMLALFILTTLWVPWPRAHHLPKPWFTLTGILSSFSTMFVGATGPLIAVFLNPARFGRDATVSTHAMCMTIQHLLKVVAFGFIGFVFTAFIPLIVLMILAGLLGTAVGVRVLRHIPEETFRGLFKLVLTLLALRLLYVALI